MKHRSNVLAVIPARGGSKGLPGKNIRSFMGLPLIAHSIIFSKMCPQISEMIVSTDSIEISDVAQIYDAWVPFIRPSTLAQDDTPMFPVLQHALAEAERIQRTTYDMLLLLDPTSPAREVQDVDNVIAELEDCPEADGVISVSQPKFNPIWHCVLEKDGWMTDLIDMGGRFERRQDVPPVYRINGCIYIWRTEYVRTCEGNWRQRGKFLMYEIPDTRAMSFDDLEEFELAESMVRQGVITLPWLVKSELDD